jgi:hypothetical protein
MTGGDYLIIRSVEAWRDQAEKAWDQIRQDNGGTLPATLREGNDINRVAFSSLIEALVALAPITGQVPDAELIALTGLRPVSEVLGD